MTVIGFHSVLTYHSPKCFFEVISISIGRGRWSNAFRYGVHPITARMFGGLGGNLHVAVSQMGFSSRAADFVDPEHFFLTQHF